MHTRNSTLNRRNIALLVGAVLLFALGYLAAGGNGAAQGIDAFLETVGLRSPSLVEEQAQRVLTGSTTSNDADPASANAIPPSRITGLVPPLFDGSDLTIPAETPDAGGDQNTPPSGPAGSSGDDDGEEAATGEGSLGVNLGVGVGDDDLGIDGDFDLNLDGDGVEAGLGLEANLGDDINAALGVDASVGTDGSVNANVDASLEAGSTNLDAGVGLGLGGDEGVSAGVDVDGNIAGEDVGVSVGLGGDEGVEIETDLPLIDEPVDEIVEPVEELLDDVVEDVDDIVDDLLGGLFG